MHSDDLAFFTFNIEFASVGVFFSFADTPNITLNLELYYSKDTCKRLRRPTQP